MLWSFKRLELLLLKTNLSFKEFISKFASSVLNKKVSFLNFIKDFIGDLVAYIDSKLEFCSSKITISFSDATISLSLNFIIPIIIFVVKLDRLPLK